MNNLHPGLLLIAAGIILLVLPKKLWRWFAVLAPIASVVAAFFLTENSQLHYAFTSTFTMELLHVDRLSWVFALVLCVIALIAGIYSFTTKGKLEKAASLVYAGGSIAVVLAGDWITLIAFWELTVVASTYLVWAGGTAASVKASYRYLVMHFFGGNMLLGGALALFFDGNGVVGALTDASGYGYWLLLLGLAVNAALPPLHAWVADAYPEATSEGMVYLGSYTTKVAIYVLIRVFAGTELLIYVGAFMAVFAVCMALLENDLKKLLSYHIVSQLGMMVAALGTGTMEGIDGATMHGLFNILYKGVLLMAAGAVVQSTGKRNISDLGGLGKKMPLVSICFFIASLAIAGMPLLNGFVSKGLIMEALSDPAYQIAFWMVTLAGIGTWLSITLKINYFVFFGKTKKDIQCQPVSSSKKIAMVIGTLLCVITGLFPELSYRLMPNQIVGHPFTADHVLEYLGLFLGGTIAFVLLRKKMVPHEGVTLDIDLIYRKPLARLLGWISSGVHRFFDQMDKRYVSFSDYICTMLNNPGKIFSRIEEIIDDDSAGETYEEHPIGELVQTIIIFCVIAFLIFIIID